MLTPHPRRRLLSILRGAWALTAVAVTAWALPCSASDGYSISNTITQQIVEHGICRKVTNALPGGKGLYVPTKYDTEWSVGTKAFINNVITGVLLAACLDAASLRFRSGNSAYLSRTFATAGNRRTWTWSGWVKRTEPGTLNVLFWAGSQPGADYFRSWLAFVAGDQLAVQLSNASAATIGSVQTSAVYRDPSAWMHVTLAVDTTQALSADRLKLYVNGAQVTSFSSASYPSQNEDTGIGNTAVNGHQIGRRNESATGGYMGGYLADVYFVDGQQLTPGAFAETDPDTGQWIPKAYTGTYGTNGFHLTFANPASLGNDSSGGAKHWTPNNFSTTAGTTYDPMADYASGSLGGNHPTWNPLDNGGFAAGTLSDANLTFTGQFGGAGGYVYSSVVPQSGKYYAEMTLVSNGGYGQGNFGIVTMPDKTGIASQWQGSGTALGYGTVGVAVDVDAAPPHSRPR